MFEEYMKKTEAKAKEKKQLMESADKARVLTLQASKVSSGIKEPKDIHQMQKQNLFENKQLQKEKEFGIKTEKRLLPDQSEHGKQPIIPAAPKTPVFSWSSRLSNAMGKEHSEEKINLPLKQTGEILSFVEDVNCGLIEMQHQGDVYFGPSLNKTRILVEEAVNLGYLITAFKACLAGKYGFLNPETRQPISVSEAIDIGFYDISKRQLINLSANEPISPYEGVKLNIVREEDLSKLFLTGILTKSPGQPGMKIVTSSGMRKIPSHHVSLLDRTSVRQVNVGSIVSSSPLNPVVSSPPYIVKEAIPREEPENQFDGEKVKAAMNFKATEFHDLLGSQVKMN